MTAARWDRAVDGELRIARLLNATPLAVWLLTATFGFLSLAYAVAVPLLHAPDEPAHVDLIAQVDDHVGLDPYDGLTYSPDIEAALPRVGIVQMDWRFAPRSPWRPLDRSDTVARTERPAYDGLASEVVGDEDNPAASHPPGYYATVDAIDDLAEAFGAGGESEVSWDSLVLRWRSWSVLIGLPLPWLAYWTAGRVTRRSRIALAAAVLPLAVPQLTHSVGSVNNDVLLFVTSGVVVLCTAWIVTGDRSWRPAVIGGLAAGVAMITKIFGLGAPLWLLGAYGGAVALDRISRSDAVARLVGAGAAALLAGGWWPLRLIITEGTPAPRDFRYPIPEGLETPFWPWAGEVVRRLTITGIGWFGIEQFRLPVWLVTVVAVATLAAVVSGVAYVMRRSSTRWAAPVVLLLPFLTTLAMVLYAAWGGYSRSGLPSGLHGRYLLVGLVGVAPLAAAGLAWWIRSTGRLLCVTCGIAAAMQATAGAVLLTSYWGGQDLLERVGTMIAFTAWSGRTIAIVGVLGLTAAVFSGVALVRETAAETRTEPA